MALRFGYMIRFVEVSFMLLLIVFNLRIVLYSNNNTNGKEKFLKR